MQAKSQEKAFPDNELRQKLAWNSGLNILFSKAYSAEAAQGLVSDDRLPDPERPNWTAILVLAFVALPGCVGIVTHGR